MAEGAGRSHLGRRPPAFRRFDSIGLFLVSVGIAGAVVAATLFGESEYIVGPFQVRVEWSPAWKGMSVLSFPPIGEVSAQTHAGPTRLGATLQSVDFQALAELVSGRSDGQDEAWRGVIKQAMRSARLFAVPRRGARWLGWNSRGGTRPFCAPAGESA